MKAAFSILLFLLPLLATAQEPILSSLQGIGGNNGDGVSLSTKTSDGGFVLHFETISAIGSGNIDSFCDATTRREIFVKYNADGSSVEWSRCYGFGGDSFFLYLFPLSDSSVVLGGEFNSGAGWGF